HAASKPAADLSGYLVLTMPLPSGVAKLGFRVCGSAHLQSNKRTTFNRSVRRTALARPAVMIGSINDPEKTKANKEKKKNDSEWAEPRNNNPLEKVSLMRDNPEGDTDQQDAERGVAAEEKKQKGIDGLSGPQKAVDKAVTGIQEAITGKSDPPKAD
ncbi:hypothetical protein WJX74_002543, partial [Apatococcus lobatus]